MALTSGLKTPRDMLAKLYREHARLKSAVTGDDLMNFAITAYHIIDWIKNNPSVSSATKTAVQSMYADANIAVCRDLANASKHFALEGDYKDRVTEKTSAISAGFGVGRYGKGDFGVGEASIVIVLTDGQRFDALDFAQGVVDAWEHFFRDHRL